MEIFESQGKLDRAVEGLEGNDEYLRREAEGHGLTRPELAVLLVDGQTGGAGCGGGRPARW
jgi:glutamate dehydrogenase